MHTDELPRFLWYCLQSPTGLHQNRWRHTQEFTGYEFDGKTRRILFWFSRVDPLPGSIDCTQGVCGVVRFDCTDGLGRLI